MSAPTTQRDLPTVRSDTIEAQEVGTLGNQDETQNGWRFPWRKFWSEFVGTALLLLLGLSVVILLFGVGSPVEAILPDMTLRRIIGGFVFGSLGASIALSPIGKESGAHINPVVTMGFWLAGKLNWRDGLVFVTAQLAGASVGCLPLLAWGSMGRSISFGATVPGKGYSILAATMGEAVTTFAMVTGLGLFLAFRNIRSFTPAMFPFLYALMVPLEAAVSGTSTNPARSLGPSIISGEWQGWWIYWAGPAAGALLALILCSRLAKRIEGAKLYHFDTDHAGVLHKLTGRAHTAD